MTDREVIKAIMNRESVSNAALARQLGITDAAIWDRLNTKKGKSLSTANLVEMLELLGYKLAAIPADAPIPEQGYPVEQG